MNTVVVDNELRVRLPTLKPGQVVAWEVTGEVVKLTPVKPVEDDVPEVRLIEGPDGYPQFPKGTQISRKSISAAIRADRDSR